MIERTSRDATPLATEGVPLCPVCSRPGVVVYAQLPCPMRCPSHLVQYLAPVGVALGIREGDEIFMTARK